MAEIRETKEAVQLKPPMRVVIVGNGSIGMMSAITIARNLPGTQVTVIGETSRLFAASTAAGAMMNVYGEVEALPHSQQRLSEKLLEMGNSSSRKWRHFLDATKGNSVITAQDTCVVLKKKAYEFETRNFGAMTDAAIGSGVGSLEQTRVLDYFAGTRSKSFEAVLRIKGEFAVDALALMGHLDKLAEELGVRRVLKSAKKIHVEPPEVEVAGGLKIGGDYVVVAAGAVSNTLFDSKLGVLEMFQGVGTALSVEGPLHKMTAPKEVIRTVNRGGAQCGLHLVPLLNQGLYIGAGNRVTKIEPPQIRFETISYLLNSVSSEFIGKDAGYLLEGQLRIGLRPRSLDGFPMIGALAQHRNIFVATGTNRAGLTWATEIADAILSWLRGDGVPDLMNDWQPDRTSLLTDNPEDSIAQYVESRIGAGLEHGIIEDSSTGISQAREQFEKVARNFTAQSASNTVPPGTHPDNWAAVEVARGQEFAR